VCNANPPGSNHVLDASGPEGDLGATTPMVGLESNSEVEDTIP
jgi:hypothetical protein